MNVRVLNKKYTRWKMSKYLHCLHGYFKMDMDHYESVVKTICDPFCLIRFSTRLSFYKGKRTLEQAGQEERPPPGIPALHPQLLQRSRRPEHSDSDTTAQLAGDELQQGQAHPGVSTLQGLRCRLPGAQQTRLGEKVPQPW